MATGCLSVAQSLGTKVNSSLDVACARGYFVLAMREFKVNAWGVDISDWALKNSPPSISQYLLRRDLNQDKLPFPDNVFEMVSSWETFEHLWNDDNAAREIYRVLADNGLFFFSAASRINDFWCSRLTGFKAEPLSHINSRLKSSWISFFIRHGFRYLFPFPKAFRRLAISVNEPRASERAKVFYRLGRFGVELRNEIAYRILSPALVFQKRRFERGSLRTNASETAWVHRI